MDWSQPDPFWDWMVTLAVRGGMGLMLLLILHALLFGGGRINKREPEVEEESEED